MSRTPLYIFIGLVESEEEMQQIHEVSIYSNESLDERKTIRIRDPYDLFIEVDGYMYRFNFDTDRRTGAPMLGLLLINGNTCEIASPPAFSYPGPYVKLGGRK